MAETIKSGRVYYGLTLTLRELRQLEDLLGATTSGRYVQHTKGRMKAWGSTLDKCRLLLEKRSAPSEDFDD